MDSRHCTFPQTSSRPWDILCKLGRKYFSLEMLRSRLETVWLATSPQATMQQYRTALIYPPELQNETGKPFRDPMEPSTWAFKGWSQQQFSKIICTFSGEWSNGSNILGVWCCHIPALHLRVPLQTNVKTYFISASNKRSQKKQVNLDCFLVLIRLTFWTFKLAFEIWAMQTKNSQTFLYSAACSKSSCFSEPNCIGKRKIGCKPFHLLCFYSATYIAPFLAIYWTA